MFLVRPLFRNHGNEINPSLIGSDSFLLELLLPLDYDVLKWMCLFS